MIEALADRVLAVTRRSWFPRLMSAGIAVGVGTVFALSALLVPSPDGHGTHLQLGLGPCTFLTLTGWPCPMCGATTSFTLMAHLRPLAAFVNQPFAAGLFLLSAGSFAVSVAEILDPRDRWTRILDAIEPYEGRLAALFLAAMGIAWAYKIATMGVFG
ncbi:MAG: DUF2752 domain-containing protein [Myxococcota bacterium]